MSFDGVLRRINNVCAAVSVGWRTSHVERPAVHHACLPDPAIPFPTGGPERDLADEVVKSWPATVRVEHTRQRHLQIQEVSDQGLSMNAVAVVWI